MKTPELLMKQILPDATGVVFQKKFLQGNEAVAEGALCAGVNFYGGYPITPSSEIMEILSMRLPRAKGVFIQMEDEIASIGSVLGASLAGAKAMTATSGPGFSLMQELIGYASMTQIPCLIVNVMRQGPSTGMPTSPSQGDVQQAVWGSHGDYPVVVVVPGSVEEMYYLTIWCVNIAERLRVPVILLPDEIIAHMREMLSVPPEEVICRERRGVPSEKPEEFKPYRCDGGAINPMPPLGTGYRHNVTGLAYDEEGFPTNDSERAGELISYLVNKVNHRATELVFAEELNTENAETIIVAYGCTARSAENAIRTLKVLGRNVGMVRLITLHPFPAALLERLAKKCDRFLLAEMNLGQLTTTVRAAVGSAVELRCVNKSNGMPITPAELVSAIETWGAKEAKLQPVLAVAL